MKAHCIKTLTDLGTDLDEPTTVYVFCTKKEALAYLSGIKKRAIIDAAYIGEQDLLEIIRSNKRCMIRGPR